ncbi:acyl carrier protein [Azospirillum thiophilum]|uniref:Acyl carrier protein n=1 Tax=Azospirillum thiophilum TaxID=528244 RepID=A0AAC8W0L8_9PROT|nr:phosphopantetheine-binding protein [Azospirillum thiophilum]ALG72915.1 acyl carrier protein [Azospirillum thiophilum]KJR64169.1 acyl carrier protein [Azospirillum thiophilum]
MVDLENEIKTLIVESLKLEDIRPEDIDSSEPLFVDGLGLDSIDALELGVALRKRFGIKIDSVTGDVKAHFANVRSLALFVQSQQVE